MNMKDVLKKIDKAGGYIVDKTSLCPIKLVERQGGYNIGEVVGMSPEKALYFVEEKKATFFTKKDLANDKVRSDSIEAQKKIIEAENKARKEAEEEAYQEAMNVAVEQAKHEGAIKGKLAAATDLASSENKKP
jgi:flagellar biosynthesis/type III secretory pathway protein FliH